MNDPLLVQETEGDENFADDEGGVFFFDRAGFHLFFPGTEGSKEEGGTGGGVSGCEQMEGGTC